MASERKNEGSPIQPTDQGGRTIEKAGQEQNTYGQILRSSVLIGTSTVVTIGIGIVRTKVMAVLLGPAGVGLLGLFGSIADVTRSIAGMGINSSGVRQIAEAVGSRDSEQIARTVMVLRRASILVGILGAGLLIAFSEQLSMFTFRSDQHAGGVALLSLAVLFRLIADGQAALIQGMRRISDLARMSILGALFGTALSIAVVYCFRADGVAPSLVIVAAITALTSWWFSRKVQIRRTVISAAQARHEAASLLKLGAAFMASGFLMMGSAYAVNTIVVRNVGLESAGLYQAAWTLGGLYVGFILQAMGADFYPRLVGVATDDPRCNRLVNEQAQVSLLLAGPGVLATLTFAPLVIALFYTPQFAASVDLLRWICLGMTLRVITWPMGYIIVAKGKRAIFFGTELAWAVVNVGLAWGFVRKVGVDGAGIAFFGSYVFHGLMIYPIVGALSGFRWSSDNRRVGSVYIVLIAVVFGAFWILPPLAATSVGVLAMTVSGVYSMRALVRLVSLERVPRSVQRLLILFRFARPRTMQ